jgi:hypothetical protein
MSQAAPSSEKAAKRAASPLAPPDERFWQRYSPHAEFPLSSAGSLVVHVLALGLLALAAWLGTVLFNHSTRQLPVEAVRISGGGGNPHGRGEGSNKGDEPIEAGNQPDKSQTETAPPDEVSPPQIEVKPDPQSKLQFDNTRKIQMPDAEDSNALNRLKQRTVTMRLPGRKPSAGSGYGQGGKGGGGGSGDGRGVGIGDGTDPGVGTPTQREKRMLRWSMLFNTPDSANYVAQLNGLGAILLVPVREDAAKGVCDYKVIRDLKARPPKLLDEDYQNIPRLVRWADDNPDSVRGVMSVLHLKLMPSHFLALMPVELEEKLLRLETDYLKRKHPGRNEDDIKATKFRIQVRKGKYEPEVIGQELK